MTCRPIAAFFGPDAQHSSSSGYAGWFKTHRSVSHSERWAAHEAGEGSALAAVPRACDSGRGIPGIKTPPVRYQPALLKPVAEGTASDLWRYPNPTLRLALSMRPRAASSAR